jgi:hypothetical protein
MVEQPKRWPPESTLRLHGRDSCSCEDTAEAIEETSGVTAHALSYVLFALVQKEASEGEQSHAESTLRLDGRDSCIYEDIAEAIEEIGGVVAHGLIIGDNVTAVVHTPEGAQILRKVC